MVLSLKNPDADRLAREVAELTGESITQAVITSLQQRLDTLSRGPDLIDRINRLAAEVAEYPMLDARSADEILGYDERGLPQ